MANPFEFLQQVRSEASKVVWPSRRETLITTGMVMLMVVFTSAVLPGRRRGVAGGGQLWRWASAAAAEPLAALAAQSRNSESRT